MRMELPRGEFFKLFFATEIGITDGPIAVELASRFVHAGCCYACAWGVDCERWHDCFDEAIVYRQLDDPKSIGRPDDLDYAIMTTWHTEAGPDLGAEFFLRSADPRPGFDSNCGVCLVLILGSQKLRTKVEDAILAVEIHDL